MSSAAANAALFDLDFTRPHVAEEDVFEVVAVRQRRAPAGNDVVLVVDGDANAGERTARLLRARGWQAVVETSPREAARHMSRLGAPALLLLEADLPQMSGFDFLQRLRANRRVADTAVVVLAGRATRGDLVRAFESGADGYVTKSAGDAALVAALEKLLGPAWENRGQTRV